MKKLAVFTVFIFLCAGAWSLDLDWLNITPQKPQFSFTQGGSYNLIKDVKNTSVGYRTVATVDLDTIYTDIGINLQGQYFDLTSNVIFWPEFLDLFHFGFGASYHCAVKSDSFVDNDFIIKTCGNFEAGFFYVSAAVGYFYKVSHFISPGTKLPDLHDDSVFIDTHFVFSLNRPAKNTFARTCSLFFDISTVSYFEYPLFLCPFFSTGFEVTLVENVSFRISVYSKWVDMIIVNMTAGNVGLDTCIKVRI